MVFAILFIFYSRNARPQLLGSIPWAPFFLAGGALLLGHTCLYAPNADICEERPSQSLLTGETLQEAAPPGFQRLPPSERLCDPKKLTVRQVAFDRGWLDGRSGYLRCCWGRPGEVARRGRLALVPDHWRGRDVAGVFLWPSSAPVTRRAAGLLEYVSAGFR